MRIFIATAKLDDIRWATGHGLVDGVLTTPSLLTAEVHPAGARELLADICRTAGLPVAVTVGSVHSSDIYRDAKELAKLGDGVLVQIPFVEDAVVAMKKLNAEGIRVAATLVFNAAQAVLAAKAGCAAAGLFLGLLAGTGLPARLAMVAAPGVALAGFLAPDALLERAASNRRRRLVSALPDALDLLAVGVASGRSPSVVFGEIAAGAGGPLAAELAVTVAEIECGASIADAVGSLRDRVPGAEVGALVTALERSRRFGSPLADQLREQATALRRDARRRIEERSSRAAPKIQLVVALVLVPSVLLMITAAIIAHSSELFGAF